MLAHYQAYDVTYQGINNPQASVSMRHYMRFDAEEALAHLKSKPPRSDWPFTPVSITPEMPGHIIKY